MIKSESRTVITVQPWPVKHVVSIGLDQHELECLNIGIDLGGDHRLEFVDDPDCADVQSIEIAGFGDLSHYDLVGRGRITGRRGNGGFVVEVDLVNRS